jgi:hypothetical protein
MPENEWVCAAAMRPTKVDELALDALVASGHYRIKSEAERQSDEDHQDRRAATDTVR